MPAVSLDLDDAHIALREPLARGEVLTDVVDGRVNVLAKPKMAQSCPPAWAGTGDDRVGRGS